jgi:MFS family permease
MVSPIRADSGLLFFLTLLVGRAVGMAFVAAALPVSHWMFGENYPGDGQQAFGFLIMFSVVGVVAAFIYLAVATLAHFMVRKKSLQTRWWVEAGVFAVFVIALVYSGITAHYS